jgi:hypothetical protein
VPEKYLLYVEVFSVSINAALKRSNNCVREVPRSSFQLVFRLSRFIEHLELFLRALAEFYLSYI